MSETMRNIPQQARSQQRVDLILDTAAALLAEIGYDTITTNAVAGRAGISVGSLYRYFADKDAILHALADRYLTRLNELHQTLFTADAIYLPLPVLLDRLIDPFVEFDQCCPAFARILLGSDVSADIARAAQQIEIDTIERIRQLLQMRVPRIDEERALMVALVCKAVVKALLALLATPVGKARQSQVIAEMKGLLLDYLAPLWDEERQA